MSNSFSVIARSQRGSANARPDDRLRDEAIRTISEEKVWIASLRFAMTRVIVPAAAIFLIALNPFPRFLLLAHVSDLLQAAFWRANRERF
jgi:hypothetical protein